MALESSFQGISSVEDALSMLKGGQHFVVCTPFQELTVQILQHLVSAAPSQGGVLVSFREGDEHLASKHLRSRVDLSSCASAAKALDPLHKAIAKSPEESLIYFHISGHLPAPFSDPEKALTLLKSARKACEPKNNIAVWCIQRYSLPPELLVQLKDTADFYLDISRKGTAYIAQFLTAKGISDADFFRPAFLTVQSNSIRLTASQSSKGTPANAADDLQSALPVQIDVQYQSVFDNAAVSMVVFEIGGQYSEFNRRAIEALGYSAAELALLKLDDLIPDGRRFEFMRSLWSLKKKGRLTFSTEVVKKNGRRIDIELSAASLGKNTFAAICRDISGTISAGKAADELTREYAGFISSLPYPYAIFVNRKLARKNPAFDLLFPHVQTSSPSVSEFFDRRNGEILKEISTLFEERGPAIVNREVLIAAPERKTIATEVSISAVQYDGKPALYCTFVDVSERRKILDKAEETEAKFSLLVDNSIDALTISQDGKFILVNRSFADMLGYGSPMDLLGKEITSVISGRNARAEILDNEKKLSDGDELSGEYEYSALRNDGSKISVVARAGRIRYADGWAILAYHKDTTRQKTLEENLDRKAKALEVLNRISDEIEESGSLDEIYQRGMNAAMKGTEFEIGALFTVDRIHATMNLRLHKSLAESIITKLGTQSLDEGFARFFNKTHEPVVASMTEYPPYLHFKSLFEAEQYTTVAFLPLVVGAALQGVLFLATAKSRTLDDNDRTVLGSLARQLSIAIHKAMLLDHARDAELRFDTTVAKISDVLYTLQPNGSFEYLSPNVETLLGFKLSDFRTNASLWRTLLHPDDRPVLSQRISNQAQGTDEFVLEYRILPKGKATYIWLQDTVRYKRNSDGAVVSIEGILSNITERRQLAELARPEDTRQRVGIDAGDVMRVLPDGLAVFTSDLRCIEWNTAMEEMTGAGRDEVIGNHLNDLPAWKKEFRDAIDGLTRLDSAGGSQNALPYESVSGGVRMRVSQMRNPDGVRTGFIILAENSAVGKDAMGGALDSEATLRGVVNAIEEAIIIADLDGQVLEVNRGFTQMTGFARDEVRLAAFPYPWLPGEETERFSRWTSGLPESGELRNLEMNWQQKSGAFMTVSVTLTLLRSASGEPMALLCIARDMSEHRTLAVSLEWKSKQFELLNKVISYGNTTADLDQIFEKVATEVLALIPYEGVSIVFLDSSQELRPWYMAVPTAAGDSQRVEELAVDATIIYDALRTGKAVVSNKNADERCQITIPLFVEDKAVGAFSLVSTLHDSFSDEELALLQPVAEHIGASIQRVKLFQQVTDDSTYIHNLLNTIHNVVYTVDSDYRVTAVNRAWHDFMVHQGLDKWAAQKSIIGQPLDIVFDDRTLWTHYKSIMDDLLTGRITSYSGDLDIPGKRHGAAYHVNISPMVMNNKVNALVFMLTDITEINRTEAQVKHRNKELLALNAIATSINRSLELDEVLRIAVEQLRDAFEASGVSFYLVDRERQLLILSRQIGRPKDQTQQLSLIPLAGSLAGQVVTTRTPVYFTEGMQVHDVTANSVDMSGLSGAQSFGIVPLQSKDSVQGVFIISFAKRHDFVENERQLLLLIGTQMGSAVENAQLYAEVQRQVNTLTTLYELGKGLTGALDLQVMLKILYRELAKALPLEAFFYHSYSQERRLLTLVCKATGGAVELFRSGAKTKDQGNWPLSVYQDVAAESHPYVGSTTAENMDSMIAVPIRSNEKVIGILSIQSGVPNLYSTAHLRLLESIGNLTGVAIGKAMLYEDTLRKSSEIENRNKDLDDFTYVVSHDLKEPLISIEGYSKIVVREYSEKLDAEGKEYLGAVIHSTTRMKHLIDDLLTLSRLGRVHEAMELISVKTLVDGIIHDLQFSLRERNVSVRVAENLPMVQYSATRLSMVFQNLISNAMKFNDKPNPAIAIGVEESGDDYVFSVADNGIGIETQYFDRIFTIFQRLKRNEEFRGTGAGLTIAKKIVEMEGGRIWVDSAPSVGSTFYFTIRKPA